MKRNNDKKTKSKEKTTKNTPIQSIRWAKRLKQGVGNFFRHQDSFRLFTKSKCVKNSQRNRWGNTFFSEVGFFVAIDTMEYLKIYGDEDTDDSQTIRKFRKKIYDSNQFALCSNMIAVLSTAPVGSSIAASSHYFSDKVKFEKGRKKNACVFNFSFIIDAAILLKQFNAVFIALEDENNSSPKEEAQRLNTIINTLIKFLPERRNYYYYKNAKKFVWCEHILNRIVLGLKTKYTVEQIAIKIGELLKS